ncbi:MAG: ABC transporter substrate-binding protein [Acetobacteraceae bacterium]
MVTDTPRGITRRTWLAGAAAAGTLPARAVLAQSGKPLRIGLLNSFSGIFAVLGEDNLNGMSLSFAQDDWQAGGRHVEIIKEDDQINPQIGLQKLKKLVESDKVDMVVGIQASNVAMAVLDYVRANKVFFICSGAGTSGLTRNPMPNLFRTSFSSPQASAVIAKWVLDNVGPETMCMSADYAGGRDTISEFKRFYVKQGGRVSKEIYAPLGTSDFSVYLADLQAANGKSLYAFYAGSDAVRFVKQYAEYGLKDKIRLSCLGFMVESDVLPAQGDAALGIVSSLHYADTLDNPANKAFVAAYRTKYKKFPSVYSEYGYVTGEVIKQAMKTLGGDTSQLGKLEEAVASVKLDAPRGPFAFNPVSHNPIENEYVRVVAEVDGRLANKVISTTPNVSDTALDA